MPFSLNSWALSVLKSGHARNAWVKSQLRAGAKSALARGTVQVAAKSV